MLSLSFAVGLWHGFPFTNVVADEMFFAGGSLRAMENYSVLPMALDVPYGTLTYYLSYIVIGIGLAILSVFYTFDLEAVKFLIIQNPFIAYGLARLVSFTLALFCLFAANSILKRYVADYRNRLLIIILLFTNILVNIVFHTNKVWVLSTTLLLVSLYFVVRVFETEENSNKKRFIWCAIISAFLSFANFPLMGMTLVSIPLILYKYRNNREFLMTIIKATLFGAVIFGLLVASNFSGIKSQVYSIIFDYTISPNALAHNASIPFSAYLHLKKVIVMFPLLIILLAYAYIRGKVKHRQVFLISGFYLVLYIVLLTVVDRWSLVDKAALRYSFPIPFLMAFLISSLDFPFRKALLIPATISVIYLLPTLYFLSVPTTSHLAVDFVRTELSSDPKAVIWNKVGADTPIPQNKLSYELFLEGKCGSLCRATLKYDLEKDFKPVTALDVHTDLGRLEEVMKDASVYYVLRAASSTPDLVEVSSFTGPVVDLNYYSADNSGSYFDPAYLMLKRFGPNIYIYKSQIK